MNVLTLVFLTEGVGKNMTVLFCKCYERSEDGMTCCFHDRDHKDDAGLAFAPRCSSLMIVFFNNTPLLPSQWPSVTDRALEHHHLINIFNRPVVCLS